MRRRAALIGIGLVLTTATLRADVAVGAGFAMLEASVSLGLAPAVFVIESIIAYRMLRGARSGNPVMAAVMANLASSIFGLVLMSFAPWAMPSARRAPNDYIVALLWLCIPFFLLSLLIEYDVVRRMMPRVERSRVLRWTIEANVVSYLMIAAVLGLMLWVGKSARLQQLLFSLV